MATNLTPDSSSHIINDTTSGLVEIAGIEIIGESARKGKPSDLFWPWFAANVSVFGISYGSYLLGFGISLRQAIIVGVLGAIISFALCGIIAIAGKRGSTPTMIVSRAAFGVHGQKLPGIVSWLTSIGWETMLAIISVLATATVFKALGVGSPDTVKLLATLFIVACIIIASVLGYHVIMRLQSIITWATGILTIVFIILVLPKLDWSLIGSRPDASIQHVFGAFVMAMTGWGLGWINIAADWSRYQKRDASSSKIVLWNTIGGAAAPIVLFILGAMLVESTPDLAGKIASDPVGALITVLPFWILIPFWLVVVVTQLSGAILGIYSSGLTLLSLGVRIPRPAAAGVDGVILTLGTIWVVFFASNFIGPFQSFLLTLGVPLASWAGILIADILMRRTVYDDAALFNADGRYGSIDWMAVGTLIVASFIGWGFVVNFFADAAPWNNWQGYLLFMVGGKDGGWAYANLGVLFSLVLSFVATLILRRNRIRKQEAGLPPHAG